MSRTLIIPPINAPGAEAATGRMEILLELVDASGDPIPASDPGNTLAVHGLGVHVVTDTAVELTLSTQDELADETYYRATVRQGRSEFRRDVQVPADEADLTWAQFLGLTDPVTGGLAWASRLLPDPTDLTDGVYTISIVDGAWVLETGD
jgi:hypothetical protein